MIIALPAPDAISPVVSLERGVLVDAVQALHEHETSTTGGELLAEIRFEGTVYRCPNTVRLNYQFYGQTWNCWARELASIYVGEGETPKLARDDWHQKFHSAFQRLYSMRPFEMSEEDARCWETILSDVDVVEYGLAKPLTVREIGCVHFLRTSYPSQMHWIDGRKESFSLHQVPDELAGCKPGQWVEAIVEREPQTGRLLRVVHVQRISSPLPESPSNVRAAWEAMRTAELIEADWDWSGTSGS